MMRKTNLMSAAVVAMLALTTIPAGESQILARDFPDLGVEAEFPAGSGSSGGAGLVDPVDPDNTCLALLFLSVGSPLLFYYTNLRVTPVGLTVDDEANLQQDLAGTPADDCFGLANPNGSDLIVDRYRGHVGGQVLSLNLLGSTQVASLPTVEFEYALCDVVVAGTNNTGDPLSADFVLCNGVANNATAGDFTPVDDDAVNPGFTTGTGFLDRDARLFMSELTHGPGGVPDVGTMDTLADPHTVVEFCVRADLFDTATGNTTTSSDRDHVLAATAAGLLNPADTAAMLVFLSDPANLSDLVTTAC